MSQGGSGESDDPVTTSRSGPARRLTISPIGFDIVLALSQAPVGLRLAEIAHTIGSPVSSTQTALRVMLANGFATRVGDEPPRYVLSRRHPAAAELAALSTVLPEPERAFGILFRANPALSFAGVDDAGFIIAVDESKREAAAALDHHMSLVQAARPSTPNILRMTADEFGRMLRVSVGVRARVRDAIILRGSAARVIATSRASIGASVAARGAGRAII